MSLSKIAVLSPAAGNGNLGDEASLTALMQNIRRRHPHIEIYVISANPRDTEIRHRVQAWPVGRRVGRAPIDGKLNQSTAGVTESASLRNVCAWGRVKAALKRAPFVFRLLKRVYGIPGLGFAILAEGRFLAASLRRVKRTDLLVMSGSGSFCDHFGGPFNFPYTIFKWTLLARVAGIPVIFPSVGLGPLLSPLSRLLVRASLTLAEYRTVRDVTSQKLLREVGWTGKTPVFPDLAYSLDVPENSGGTTRGGLLVGINVFPHFDARFWPDADPAKYERYIDCIASFVAWLFQHGYRVALFPTQIRADTMVIDDVKHLVSQRYSPEVAQSLLESSVRHVSDLLCVLSSVDLVVASRFHGTLLSFPLIRQYEGLFDDV
ncbi:MAG: hypothetical protein DMG11_23650 [Acidobacteria bacterium]|nr:MAG: hypothetical protein DMG11_23650 [Acidobacteriota bacterium]